ncbi:hypothetical protein LMED105_02063 [Limnobacter sp. MED105]|nr:hypothetical protein LMED105_02063 [Limnobacter sp. MED105]
MTVWEINLKVVDFRVCEVKFCAKFSGIRDLQDGI